jgi:hypothetical protein
MAERRVVAPRSDRWGWEEHQRAQRRRFARVPLADKIAWLEEAHRLVLTLEKQRPAKIDGTTGVHEPR